MIRKLPASALLQYIRQLFRIDRRYSIKLLITIDTEEDNWARYSTTDNTVNNIERLPQLQELFDRYKARPTYLVTYPVATNPRSVEILKELLDHGKCEIGMHCHPWNTPPFEESISAFNSMLCNLPEELVARKLQILHEAIRENFNTTPVSFRAGRWGFSSSVARALAHLNYKVDTSVSPSVNWMKYHGPDFSDFQLRPFYFNPGDPATPDAGGALLEIPATIGFLRDFGEGFKKWANNLEKATWRKFYILRTLRKFRIINKVWLSPELADAKSMIILAERLRKIHFPCLNMSFHSTSLLAGLSPFTTVHNDEALLQEKIEKFLIYAQEKKISSSVLKDYAIDFKFSEHHQSTGADKYSRFLN